MKEKIKKKLLLCNRSQEFKKISMNHFKNQNCMDVSNLTKAQRLELKAQLEAEERAEEAKPAT